MLKPVLMIKGGFCCNAMLLYNGTVLKFFKALIFVIAINFF